MKIPSDGAGLPAALLVSLLLMIGVAAVGTAAGPDVVAGRPTAPQVPAQPPTTNEAVLREALGEAFEVRDGQVVAERLEGLPIELAAHANVSVVPAGASSFACAPADAPGTCRAERVAPGVAVYIVTSEAVHSAAGSNFGETTVRHERAGFLARVQLSVLGKPAGGSTPELERTVRDWLKAIEPRLIAAATDERLKVPDTDAGNREVLREVLGTASFGPDLAVIPGSPAGAGLPAGFQAAAGTRVGPVEHSLAQHCPVNPAPEETCEVRELADGTKVAVEVKPLRVLETGDAVASVLVSFIQENGDLVQAGVSATGTPDPADAAAVGEQLNTWLAQLEDRLIDAATDPRMRRGS